jgi:hypothetical protein
VHLEKQSISLVARDTNKNKNFLLHKNLFMYIRSNKRIKYFNEISVSAKIRWLDMYIVGSVIP